MCTVCVSDNDVGSTMSVPMVLVVRSKGIECHLFVTKFPFYFFPHTFLVRTPCYHPMTISSHSSSRDFPCVLLRTLEERALETAAA